VVIVKPMLALWNINNSKRKHDMIQILVVLKLPEIKCHVLIAQAGFNACLAKYAQKCHTTTIPAGETPVLPFNFKHEQTHSVVFRASANPSVPHSSPPYLALPSESKASTIKVTEPLIRQSSANYGDRNDIERITRAARKAAFALSAGEGRGV
jgi:hypothetical protein